MALTKEDKALLMEIDKKLSHLLSVTCSGGMGFQFTREGAYRITNICKELTGGKKVDNPYTHGK